MSNILTANITWFAACRTADVPLNGGVCVKYNDQQIALFHFARRNEWYANMVFIGVETCENESKKMVA